MITAHLPAGYVLTTALRRRWPEVPLWVGLVASVFPDVDLLYFYLVDHRRTPHHHYWTHLPLPWLALTACTLVGLRVASRRQWEGFAVVFFANVLLHHILDTIVGRIPWVAPFSWHDSYLFTIPVRHAFWLWNFVLHWSFGFELVVWVVALVVWQRNRKVSGRTIWTGRSADEESGQAA